MSKENSLIISCINSREDKALLLQLRKNIPEDVLDIIESSIIDASKIQLIPINTMYILGLFFNIEFKSKHVDGKDNSPSESIVINLLDEIDKEFHNQSVNTIDNTRPNFISDSYSDDDPISIHNTLIAYTKDMKWIDVGDYLIELHNSSKDSPYLCDYLNLRFIKNGKMIKLFNYSKNDNLESYLNDLCGYLSSYSNKVSWSYRN